MAKATKPTTLAAKLQAEIEERLRAINCSDTARKLREQMAAALAEAERAAEDRRVVRDGLKEPPWRKLAGGEPVAKKKKSKKEFQADRVRRVLPGLYPDGADGIPTLVVTRRVATALGPESRQLGLRDPSAAVVGRVLGRRR